MNLMSTAVKLRNIFMTAGHEAICNVADLKCMHTGLQVVDAGADPSRKGFRQSGCMKKSHNLKEVGASP